ncbi:MAG: phosphotransferase family protein [Acidobacteriota bacterium]|nr:phosphotransferase family protein [Acidobacteriota bacterium]
MTSPTTLDTASIRKGEELDVTALSAYLADKLEGAAAGLTVEQFPGGHSNLTYLLRTPAREFVLRRGPLGPVAPKAHDMAREYRVLQAVHPFFRPAPEVFHLCQDPAVLGAVFFVMERLRGIIVRDSIPPALAAFADYEHRVSQGFIECLVQLHSVDIEKHGLTALGKPVGFLDRQVRGWFERWQRSKTEDVPAMDGVMRWLGDNMPVSPPATLVHNDFKLDNVMINAYDPGRIEAVLDWEMCTVGDPLVDLGLILCYWSQPSDPGGSKASLTLAPGWFTPDQVIETYAAQTGRDVSQIRYYQVFAVFKLAVVLQQIYYRFYRGQTQDQRFRHFDQRVRNLINQAVALI